MAEQTTNYNLIKDSADDFYSIEVVNVNLDKIDAELKNISDKANSEKTASEIKFVNTISTADIDNVQDAITTMVTETKAGLELIMTKADSAQNKADQAFTQASNGKEAIKTAITGKDPSVTIPTDATFAQLAAAIGQIETGVNTDDATATAEYLLAGLTAYVKGMKVTGTMANRGAVNQSLGVNGTYIIPQGYHNGQGKVSQSIPTKAAQNYTPGVSNQTIAANQFLTGAQTIQGDANLISANILQGKNIFGIAGSAVQGKRWASGSYVLANTPRKAFTTSENGYQGFPSLHVTGLSFTPSIVIVYASDLFYCCTSIYNKDFNIQNKPLTKVLVQNQRVLAVGVNNSFSAAVNVVGECFVIHGEFSLPLHENTEGLPGGNWIAYE